MFKIKRQKLASELNLLQLAAEKKGTIPILSTVLVEIANGKAKLTATDLDVRLSTQVEAEGNEWAGCIPSRQFSSLVKLFEADEVAFTEKPKGRILITCGEAKHLLPTEHVDGYPAPETGIPASSVTIDAKLLSEMIESTSFAVTKHEDHMKAADLKFTGLRVRVVNGLLSVIGFGGKYAAFATEAIGEADIDTVIPPAAFRVLKRFKDGPVSMSVSTNHALFQHGDYVLTSRLFAEAWPDWEGLMPKEYPHRAEVKAESLRRAIQRAYITNPGRDKLLFRLKKNQIDIEAEETNLGAGEESVEAQSNMNGDVVEIGINGKQVLEFLSVIEGDPIVEAIGPEQPLRLRPREGTRYQYLTMPMRK